MLPLAIAIIMVGCCSNFLSLEYIIELDRGCGALLTLAQFVYISVQSLPSQLQISKHSILKQRNIPITYHLLLVLLFYVQAIINNIVFTFQISLPLHAIFRSGSLVMNLLIGYFFFHRKYPIFKVVCVMLITLGIIMATLLSSTPHSSTTTNASFSIEWMIGIGLLVLSQIMAALLGFAQEALYAKFGKHWQEHMFYSHILSIPFLLLNVKDISHHIQVFQASKVLFTIPGIDWQVPCLWCYLLLNVITQHMCVGGVYYLSSISNALTLTLVVTVRKFVSILISVILFEHQFQWIHWISVILVFGGTFAFAMYEEYAKKKQIAVEKKE